MVGEQISSALNSSNRFSLNASGDLNLIVNFISVHMPNLQTLCLCHGLGILIDPTNEVGKATIARQGVIYKIELYVGSESEIRQRDQFIAFERD